MPTCKEFGPGEQFGVGRDYVVTIVEIRGDEVVFAISTNHRSEGCDSNRPAARVAVSRRGFSVPGGINAF